MRRYEVLECDGGYEGRCSDLPHLSSWEDTPEEALAAIQYEVEAFEESSFVDDEDGCDDDY